MSKNINLINSFDFYKARKLAVIKNKKIGCYLFWLLFSDFYKNAEVKLTYFDRKQLKTKTLAVLKCNKTKTS